LALYDFFVLSHDPRFVLVAALVCLIAAYACIGLVRHAKSLSGRMRLVWLLVAALAVGFGIWTTHFVAMLAFRPGFTLQYDLGLTVFSLAVAIGLCFIGLAMATRGTDPIGHFAGGAVIGLGISAMHYIGIASLIMGGAIGWNGALIATSVVAGMTFAGLAGMQAMAPGRAALWRGAGLLTLAICSMHFTAMGAADFSTCFGLMAAGMNSNLLSIGVALVSLLILGAALVSLALDNAERRRSLRERERRLLDAERLREVSAKLELALSHMAQGLGLFDPEGKLRLHNKRLTQLMGVAPGTALEGLSFAEICRRALQATRAEVEIDAEVDAFIAQHAAVIASPKGGDLVHALGDGRYFHIRHSPIGDGSWVTTIDDITERKRAEAEIAHLAFHDGLTGLPNRARFNSAFQAALPAVPANGGRLTVVAIDLDQFKEINDSHGHAAGDAVLKTLADRLRDALEADEVVARVGGDEFAAFKMLAAGQSPEDFLSRLEAAFTAKVPFGDQLIVSGASLGVAVYPQDGTSLTKLMSNADLALYRAKGETEARIRFYEPAMDELARARRALVRDLWEAIETDGFHLAYQVQKSVLSGEITGYEVLIRWNRPGHGLVSPAYFIPAAESSGAITAIGEWVLRAACKEAAAWPEPHKIAVNISSVQLGQSSLVQTVRSALEQSGLDPRRLELEVTETAIIADKDRALINLREIRAMGVSIAIDDFGTGYSSLETLRAFPFDKIKLDRSFMSAIDHDEQAKAIVRAILALGRTLKVPVLAEGVETVEQLHVLQVEGCTEAQGFLLGRPGDIVWADHSARYAEA